MVTTSLLGDVVAEMVGDRAEVTTIMPGGADPHDFSASARQAAQMREADVLVTNGEGLEAALLDVIRGAEGDGAVVIEAIDSVDVLRDEGVDPHFFTDPARMADAVRGLADELAAVVPDLDTDAFRDGAEAYGAELDALDAEVEDTLGSIEPDDRVLVTNHDVFAYLADRYGFAVVGTVIPSGSTAEGVGGGELADLVTTIEAEGVRAVFVDASSPDDLARAAAEEVGGEIAVIELFSESLGEAGSGGETYVDMVRANARRIADALG